MNDPTCTCFDSGKGICIHACGRGVTAFNAKPLNQFLIKYLRDEFAMAALTGLVQWADRHGFTSYEQIAKQAYLYADAALAERAKEKK